MIDAPWQPAFDAYNNHLMGPGARDNCCHAPTGRLCDEGRRLRRAYTLSWHTEHVLAGGTLSERRARFSAVPEALQEDVRAAVLEVWAKKSPQ